METSSATPIDFYEHVSPEVRLDSAITEDPDWHPIEFKREATDPIKSLRIVTWNVWFDKVQQKTRFLGTLDELSKLPNIDVVSLQEVTKEFLEWLKSTPDIRADWLVTDRWDADHAREVPENYYGCIFLLRKKWAGNVRAWVQKFPTSKMGRFVLMAEFFQAGKTLIRVTNVHTDSPYPDIEEREREADICLELLSNPNLKGASELSSSTLFIHSGDLNTVTTSELEYITSKGFKDSITSSQMDAEVENPESATIGLTFGLPEYAPRRSDFILYKGDGWKCLEHVHFGEKPMVDSNGEAFPCERGMHGYLYPSDHLAVFAVFSKST